MPRKPVFAIDHDDLLRRTRRLCRDMRKATSAREQERKGLVSRLEGKVEAAKVTLISLRNNKRSPQFAVAKDELARAREELRRAKEAADGGDPDVTADIAMMLDKRRKRQEEDERAPLALMQSIRDEQLRQAKKHFSTKRHPKTWDPSIQAGNTIMRKFVALGPSDPKMLRPAGTRFSADRPKIPWRAVPEGRNFASTLPSPPKKGRRRRTISGKSGALTARTGKASEGGRSRRTRRRQSAASGSVMGIYERVAAEGRKETKPPWRAADGVSRVFSYPAYNRPATAHEKHQAVLMTTPSRLLYNPVSHGKPAWRAPRPNARLFAATLQPPPPRQAEPSTAYTSASSAYE